MKVWVVECNMGREGKMLIALCKTKEQALQVKGGKMGYEHTYDSIHCWHEVSEWEVEG